MYLKVYCDAKRVVILKLLPHERFYLNRFGHKEVVKFLIAHAPVCILDMVDNEKGQTALHKAAGYKRRSV